MHLGMSIRYTLKNPGKDYRGFLGEHITYGARGPVSLHGLLACLITEIVHYYIRFQDAATINASLDKLRAALETLKVVEEHVEPEEADSDDLPDIFDMHHDLLDLP
ncbi:MAG TPA: hypothetical protein VMY98_02240 [Anaerolineae bacterium]|nr:hypothetical protein [Anaerolineae bacterium]